MARLTEHRSRQQGPTQQGPTKQGPVQRGPTRVDGDGDGRVREALTSIGAHARTANLVRAEQLTDALSRLDSDSLTETQREAAMRSAHQLAGSAGTFGQELASRAARWLERFFSEPGPRDRHDLERARRQLEDLNRSLEAPPDLG